ncbi:hypothetical protein Tco_0730160 [Tanacetum coccineum]|uniref:Uncharacterized protein n=1 Tax=Tanacetum coccineum TaxID=301880 RepID=A0ABQ4YR08_9ASTR
MRHSTRSFHKSVGSVFSTRCSVYLKSKEATLQVVYDVLKLTLFYKAFQASADVPEIYMQEFWATASVHNWDDPMFTTINVISRHEDTQLYGAILPKELTNKDIRNSESYKEYYVIASREVPPKTKASVHKKKIAIKRSRIQTHSSQASGSGDGVDILSKVPDEQVHEKIDDDADKCLDAHDDDDDDDDDDATESDDDGRQTLLIHKWSTFSTDMIMKKK